MNITISNGKTLRGDLVESCIIRSDLVAIPETVEAVFRTDFDLLPFLAEGQIIRTGVDNSEYQIIKREPFNNIQGVQGNRPLGVFRIIAILRHTHQLAFIRKSAVIKDSSSMGSLYRACGSTANTEIDLTCGRFACLVGQYPSVAIARQLQDEGGSVVWTGKALRFFRNKDLFLQLPSRYLERDTTQDIESSFLERHEVPEYYSTVDDGSMTSGGNGKIRVIAYKPRADERILRNGSDVLINRKILRGSYTPNTRAGNIFNIAGVPYVAITAVHVNKPDSQYSKIWLGSLS